METLTRDEISTLLFSIEEMLRSGVISDVDQYNFNLVETLHRKLKVMYTTHLRVEDGKYKKLTCPMCGNALEINGEK